MKSGHARFRRVCAAWALACAWLCVARVQAQQAQSPVVCAAFDDAELLARIRGQTRDLPIRLVPAPDESVTQPTAAQLLTIARSHKAEFVVSVDQEPGAARVVYVFDALTSELRVRTAPAPDRKHRFGRSAAAETVALIVRGELSDALAVREEREAAESHGTDTPAAPGRNSASVNAPPEQPSQRAQATPADEPAAPPATPPKRAEPRRKPARTQRVEAVPDEPEPAPEQEPEPASTGSWLDGSQLSLELAGRASMVVARRYFFGGALGLRWTLRNLSLGVTGSMSLADSAERQGLTLSLREQTVSAEALGHVPLSAALTAGFGIAGRLSFYRRTASSADPTWKPQPSETSTTAALGPLAELRWQLQQHIGIGIRIGLDVLLRPVTFRYRLDTNTSDPVELERQNRVAPWLSLGVYGSL